ncbi:MAG: hypothetical protein J5477_01200 [Schwartzia sp.]|nr:hypothetical protein [Schwartzia sp. (in: firmicutes)]MBR5163612.1 hypothetical protein [Schwartzia sp. (in: firmicutes)]
MRLIPTPRFEQDVKFYIRKKKYLKIKEDIKSVTDKLEHGLLVGDELQDIVVSGKTFKVRIANSSANVGKTNGFRLLYYVVTEEGDIYLLTIYSKKDDDKVLTDAEIRELIKQYV